MCFTIKGNHNASHAYLCSILFTYRRVTELELRDYKIYFSVTIFECKTSNGAKHSSFEHALPPFFSFSFLAVRVVIIIPITFEKLSLPPTRQLILQALCEELRIKRKKFPSNLSLSPSHLPPQ